MHGLA